MSLIFKLPGPLLVFFGACFLSFGGLIVKSFEGSTLWQILFWRQFFSNNRNIFLVYLYKLKFLKQFMFRIPGLIGGIILGLDLAVMFAMYNTTVAMRIYNSNTIYFFSNFYYFF